MEEFYRPQLQKLGYELHEAYRRERDAVVVGFKRDNFQILRKEIVDYNNIAKLYHDIPSS